MRKHRLDPFSLVFGATFSLLSGLFLFAHADVEDLHLKWFWPVPLIVLGALIIGLSMRENRARSRRGDGDE
ncbi:MAG: hypothetical protein ACRDKS_16715 [Actinomycetota bacterium]